MQVLLFLVYWIQISSYKKKSRTNQFTELRDLQGLHSDYFMSVLLLICSSLKNAPVTKQRVVSAPSLCCERWWWCWWDTSAASWMQLLQACSKVPENDRENILLCRRCLCGHVLRFPAEDWCVEMFEHRDYFGELLSIFERTAMTAVNLKVEKKREYKETVQVSMCGEYKFKNSVLHCGFLFFLRGP